MTAFPDVTARHLEEVALLKALENAALKFQELDGWVEERRI